VYGAGDCSENSFCHAPVAGRCIFGKCHCLPGFLGSDCGVSTSCRFWDEAKQAYVTDGLVPSPPPPGEPNNFLYCESTHLTDFGVISFPTSLDDLLKDLTSIQWNTFSLDDVAAVLTSFNFSENIAVYLFIFIITGLDVVCLMWLGCFRGHRKQVVRAREGRSFWHEIEKQRFREAEQKMAKLQAAAKRRRAILSAARYATELSCTATAQRALTCDACTSHSRVDHDRAVGNARATSEILFRPNTPSSPTLFARENVGTAYSSSSGGRSPLHSEVGLSQQTTYENGGPSPPPSPSSVRRSLRSESSKSQIRSLSRNDQSFICRKPTDNSHISRRYLDSNGKAYVDDKGNLHFSDFTSRAQRRQLEAKLEQRNKRELMLEQARKIKANNSTRKKRTMTAAVSTATNKASGFWSSLKTTFRNEHTLVGLVSPPEEDEALTTAQLVQLFFTALMVDMGFACFNADTSSSSSGGGGGRPELVGVVENLSTKGWKDGGRRPKNELLHSSVDS